MVDSSRVSSHLVLVRFRSLSVVCFLLLGCSFLLSFRLTLALSRPCLPALAFSFPFPSLHTHTPSHLFLSSLSLALNEIEFLTRRANESKMKREETRGRVEWD